MIIAVRYYSLEHSIVKLVIIYYIIAVLYNARSARECPKYNYNIVWIKIKILYFKQYFFIASTREAGVYAG
jgi:hypothetical protein